MKLIRTKKDLEGVRFKNTEIKEPKCLPCIIYDEWTDFGIMGYGYVTCIHYIPRKQKHLKSYFKGFCAAKDL